MSKRINLQFSDEAASRLNAIKILAEEDSDAEVIRSALRVYEWHIQQAKDGYEIGLVKNGTLEKIVKIFT